MNRQSITFIPKYEISKEMKQVINKLAGKCFNNKTLSINMDSVQYNTNSQQDYILLSLSHLGINAEVYVHMAEADRLLGLNVKHLAHDYLSYVVTQALSQYGITLQNHLGVNTPEQHLLIACQIHMGDLVVSAFLDLDTLDIHHEHLQARLSALPPTLLLSSAIIAFDTMLSVDEIRDLSADELVLVYPK